MIENNEKVLNLVIFCIYMINFYLKYFNSFPDLLKKNYNITKRDTNDDQALKKKKLLRK